MALFTDLIQTYSNAIDLPIGFFTLEGELVGRSCDSAYSFDRHFSNGVHVKDLLKTVKTIHQATPISVSDNQPETEWQVVITPIIPFPDQPLSLIAGPYTEWVGDQSDFKTKIAVLDDERKAYILKKMNALYDLLLYIATKEGENHARKLLVQDVPDFSEATSVCKDMRHYKGYVAELIDRMLEVCHLDFLGYAFLIEGDLLRINQVRGEKAQALLNQSFYVGEGLLGKAFVMDKRVEWSLKNDPYRVAFFHKHGLSPTHLFCFPLQVLGETTGVFFGGNIKNQTVNHDLLGILQDFSRILLEKFNAHKKTQDDHDKDLSLDALRDLIEVFSETNDSVHFIYRVLDVCQSLNKGGCVAYTGRTGKPLMRGRLNDGLMTRHHQLVKMPEPAKSDLLLIDPPPGTGIHASIFLEDDWQGLLSVEKTPALSETFPSILLTMARLIQQHLMVTSLVDKKDGASQSAKEGLVSNRRERQENDESAAPLLTNKITDLYSSLSVIQDLPLTSREKEVLHLILEGLNNKEVGSYLNISVHTVKNHVTSIFKKLNVSDRIQAMTKIYRIKFGENPLHILSE